MPRMLDPASALGAALRPSPASVEGAGLGLHASTRVLVLGGAGTLGSAVVEHLARAGRFRPLGVVVSRPMHSLVRGVQMVDDSDLAWHRYAADTAVIVFDRTRRAHGREDALLRPRPEELAPLAARLAAAGVRRLLVAMPHGPQGLPAALRVGLANLDEAAVGELGFEHLVFCRLATSADPADAAAAAPQRLAAWMLSTLQWMVPAWHAPVLPTTVARVVSAVLQSWAEAPAGTRVLPAELLWHAAQTRDVLPLVHDWLAGRPLPPTRAPRRRW